MRLKIVALPNTVDGRFADALSAGQGPAAPMGHAFGLATQGHIHNGLDLFRPVGGFATASWGYLPQPFRTFLLETTPPKHHSLAIDLKLRGDPVIGRAFRRAQNDVAPQGDLLRRSESRCPRAQLLLVRFFQFKTTGISRHNSAYS